MMNEEKEYEDQTLTCVDCESQFIHTAGEQSFMREKFGEGYAAPRRCRDCRKKRRENSRG